MPPIFSNYVTDSGLLILSRFPIIEQEFCPYPYGVASDSLSYKGVLYAKIAVTEGRILHLFNTHTQATYFGVNLDNFVTSLFLLTATIGGYFLDPIHLDKDRPQIHRAKD